ncbi:Cbb3-type cytochrome c oxidase subunit CcoP2 [compost metagenome]
MRNRTIRVLGFLGAAVVALGGVSPATAANLEAGRETYESYCASCHGEQGRHLSAPDLSNPDFLSITSSQLLRRMIEAGRPGRPMPPWQDMLEDEEMRDLVAYIKGWQKGPDVPLPQGKIAGDAKQGSALYATTCAGCHGANGKGDSAPALNNPGFLRVVNDAYIKKTIEIGRPGTAMRSFLGPMGLANLSEQEIDHVVTYIRSWEQRR